MSTKIYVDGCILPAKKSGGIGVYCPDYPQINASERLLKDLGLDINLCELYAIIRGMERALEHGLRRITIVTDSEQACNVANTEVHLWPTYYLSLQSRFNEAKRQFFSISVIMAHGDGNHQEADQRARRGAEQ